MATELRPITLAELPTVCALHQRSQRHDGIPELLQLEQLEEELDDEHVVLATDTRLAVVDGEPVGYVQTFHLPSDVREERCYVFGAVDPVHRGKGLGTALMQWALARGAEQLRSSGRSLPRYLRAEAPDYIESAHRLYARVGMLPIRYGEELLRPLTELPPVPVIEGVRIVPWPADRDEDIRIAKNLSFADHWGSTPTSPHNWENMVHGFGARPDLSVVAVDAQGAIVGHCLNSRYEVEDEVIGRRDAWIANLGTLRECRGRGIASALIAHSLAAFVAAGCTHASIGVDSANPSGAARLYRALGFVPIQRSITHQLVVD